MSLVWGKLVHPLTGYSIPPPEGALLVVPPTQWGIYFDHPLPPPIAGLLIKHNSADEITVGHRDTCGSLRVSCDAQTHSRRFTPTELRHSSIFATWCAEQRRCTGRRPPRCSNWFWKNGIQNKVQH